MSRVSGEQIRVSDTPLRPPRPGPRPVLRHRDVPRRDRAARVGATASTFFVKKGEQTDLLTPNGVREMGGRPSPAAAARGDMRPPEAVSRVSGEQIRVSDTPSVHRVQVLDPSCGTGPPRRGGTRALLKP